MSENLVFIEKTGTVSIYLNNSAKFSIMAQDLSAMYFNRDVVPDMNSKPVNHKVL